MTTMEGPALSLQADTDQCVTFDVVLLRPMQAVSAEFECGYGHFVVTFNQPIRRSVEIMNFALARSSSPPQTALGPLLNKVAMRIIRRIAGHQSPIANRCHT